MFVIVQGEVKIEDFMTGVAEVFVLGHTHLPIEIPKEILGLPMGVSSEAKLSLPSQSNRPWKSKEQVVDQNC
jgi:hypothetical protein